MNLSLIINNTIYDKIKWFNINFDGRKIFVILGKILYTDEQNYTTQIGSIVFDDTNKENRIQVALNEKGKRLLDEEFDSIFKFNS